MRLAIPVAIVCTLSGCAQSPPAEPLVKAATVQVTSSDFCEIMKALSPTGKLTWSVADTPETINQVRRVNAAYDKRCQSIRTRPPTS